MSSPGATETQRSDADRHPPWAVSHRPVRFAIQSVILFGIGSGFMVCLDLLEKAAVISGLTEAAVRLIAWVAVLACFVILSRRAFGPGPIRYTVAVIAVLVGWGMVLSLTDDIRALDGVPLIGHHGAFALLFEKLTMIGWVCST